MTGAARAGRLTVPSGREPASAERDVCFREALASGEITGDIVAVEGQGREVRRKTSNIFDS